MHLIFDVETTGLPDWKAPSDSPQQPHLVQLAMVLLDGDMRERASVSLMIKPDGWVIPDDVAAIHGITTEMATQYGVPEKTAALLYARLAYDTGATLVAHNIPFDLRLMRIALLRAGLTKEKLERSDPTFCTMKAATPIVNIPPTEKMLAAGFNKPKNASLSECIEHFFSEKLDGAHDAMIDVRACLRVYRHLLGAAGHAAEPPVPTLRKPPAAVDGVGDVV